MEKIELRKIVPIAAMISAGKSKLFNVILNIDFLESKEGIGTKFVNILRYNPKIREPIFYHLILKNENGKFVFYKDPDFEPKIGQKNIIEANININKDLADKSNVDYDDIFYITEINNKGFIKDENYMLNHDLCDIPGLSEYQEEQNNENINKNDNKDLKEEEDLEEKKKKGQDFGLIYKPKKKENNSLLFKRNKRKEDDIFYNIDIKKESTYITEIYKRIKDCIDGAIIVLSIENYNFVENIEIIAKLHKVIEKPIQNFLIILNKIDLSTDLIRDIDTCKGILFNAFPKCQTFNLNMNTFIPLSVYQVQNELLMENSFFHLIKYHFYNYKKIIMQDKLLNNTTIGKTFINHLRDLLKKIGINKREIENKIDELNNGENISIINEEIKTIIRDLDKISKGEIDLGIKENDVDEDEDEEDFLSTLSSRKTSDSLNNIDDVAPVSIIKIFYILQKEKKLIPPKSNETNKLLNYFSLNDNNKNENNNNEIETTNNNVDLNNQIIEALTLFYDEFKASDSDIVQIQILSKEVEKLIEYLKIYDVIFIPFLGASNSGKSTIINGIIGRDLLPCDLKECTKRGIIIKYSDEENIIKKANFIGEDFLEKKYYYFESEDVIGKGDEQIQQTLKGLNLKFNNREEDSFYYIKTKIKLFDILGLDKSLKEMIYLIDFPGYGTGNFFENEICNKVISICNSFVFITRNSAIKNKDTKYVLDSFIKAKESKMKFSSHLIKTSLFVFNNDANQTSTQEDIEKGKRDIQTLIKGIDKNDIKLTFYNAKYYLNYCSLYNYFYKWEETLKIEYDNFINMNSSFFKNPKANESYLNRSFPQHLCDLLIQKASNFKAKMKRSQKYDKEIEQYTNNFFKEIGEFTNENKNNIIKISSFCKENINKISIFQESNIEEFKNKLKLQIEYVNENKQSELRESIDNIISILDMFFGQNFKEKKKDLEEIEKFQNKMNNLKSKIHSLIENNIKDNKDMIKKFKSETLLSLYEKRKNLQQLLNKKYYTEIVKEINEELQKNISILLDNIRFYLDKYDSTCSNLLNKIIQVINNFQEIKIQSFVKYNFKPHLSNALGDGKKDINNEIMTEIQNKCENLSSIFDKKGFKEWFLSFFSSEIYMQNVIDMVVETYSFKIEEFMNIIIQESNNYLTIISNKIDHHINSFTMKISDNQKQKWKNICDKYEKTKAKIIEIENRNNFK